MGIGKGTVYCRVCGNRIPSSDFTGGQAGTDSGGHFCRDCSGGVGEAAKGDAGRGARPSRASRPQKGPSGDARPRSTGSRFPLVVAVVIGLLVVALLLFSSMRGHGRPG
jgi:hypothetical protein